MIVQRGRGSTVLKVKHQENLLEDINKKWIWISKIEMGIVIQAEGLAWKKDEMHEIT